MFIPYSNNYNSDSYKTYKNNSEKLAKKLNQSGGSLCEVLSKDLPGRLRQRDFTCAVDPDTNKTINHILQYIWDTIIQYKQTPDNTVKYDAFVDAINSAARRLSNDNCSNITKNTNEINKLSSMMCNYLFIEHVKDLYFMPKYINKINENNKNMRVYSQIGLLVDALAVLACLVFIVIYISKQTV